MAGLRLTPYAQGDSPRSQSTFTSSSSNVPLTVPTTPNIFGDQFVLSPLDPYFPQSPLLSPPLRRFIDISCGESIPYDEPSPFDFLPTELIAVVFLHVVLPSQPSHAQPNWPLRRTPNPLSLCGVCHRWRQVAFATPELWSRLFLRFKRPLADGFERVLLAQWLDRAKAVPLSLSIPRQLYERVDRTRPTGGLDRIAKDMTTTVLSILPRCQEIYMGMDRNPSGLNTKIPDSLAKYMKSTTEPHVLGGNNVVIDLRGCANLQALTSSGDSKYQFSQFQFSSRQYHSLRRMTVQGSMKDLYHILGQFTSLVELKFDVRWSSVEDTLTHSIPSDSPLLSRPSLERLEVRCQYNRTPSQWSIWDQLYLPNLKALNVDLWKLVNEETGGPAWSSFYEFLHRSRPPLRELSLSSAAVIAESQFIELMSWTPTLKSIHLDVSGNYSPITTAFWHSLLPAQASEGDRMASRPFCPSLETLVLSATAWHDLNDIHSIVKSRFMSSIDMVSIPPMRELRLSPCSFTKEQFYACADMERLPSGLDVKISRDKFCALFHR